MSMLRKIALGTLAAASCGVAAPQSSSDATAEAPAPRVKSSARRPAGKPTAPIAVAYELSAEPMVGQPLEVRIAARAAEGIGDLGLELRAADHLYVGPPVAAPTATGETRAWTVTVTLLTAASAELNVFVSGMRDGQQQTRSLAIAIRPADAPPGAAAAPGTHAPGETVISLPAQESP